MCAFAVCGVCVCVCRCCLLCVLLCCTCCVAVFECVVGRCGCVLLHVPFRVLWYCAAVYFVVLNPWFELCVYVSVCGVMAA